MEERASLVNCYFALGYSNKEILASLAQRHKIIMSIRTLKRIMSNLQLFRKKNYSDIVDVATYIVSQCKDTGCDHGYRWMHQKCLGEGFVVTQDTVRCLLSIIDPEGVQCRTKRRLRRRQYENPGPNYVWHIDG